MSNKRHLRKYALPSINLPDFNEKPNIENSFYKPKKEIDVPGQSDLPKCDQANANDVKQFPCINKSNLKINDTWIETGGREIKQGDKLNMTLQQNNTKPCEQTPVARIVKEEESCTSFLPSKKLKNDQRKVYFTKHMQRKVFEKYEPFVFSSRHVKANQTKKVQGVHYKSILKKASGRTQPIAHECTVKTYSHAFPKVTWKNAKTEYSVANIFPSQRAEQKNSEELSTITDSQNAVRLCDKNKETSMKYTEKLSTITDSQNAACLCEGQRD